MTYSNTAAQAIASEWGLGPDQIEQWKESGLIPDSFALHKNDLTPVRISKHDQLVLLCAQGYLKSREVCRQFGWHTRRISDLLTYLRDPENNTRRKLYGEEIDAVDDELLSKLREQLTCLLYDLDNWQPSLRTLVNTIPALNPSRLTLGLSDTDRQLVRSFLNGSTPRLYGGPHIAEHVLNECKNILSILQNQPQHGASK